MLKYLLVATSTTQLILSATFAIAEPESKGCVWNNEVNRVGVRLSVVGEDDRMYQLMCVQRVEPEKSVAGKFKINPTEYFWALVPTLNQ